MPGEASCSHTVTHPSRLVRTCKAVGYSAFCLGKGVKSGVCSSQQREAKSLQILLSLSRAEKYSFLRKDVPKPSAAATVWPGICLLLEQTVLRVPAHQPGLTAASGGGLAITAPASFVAPWLPSLSPGSRWPCKNFGVFKSIFFKDKCCLYRQKDSSESAWPQMSTLTLRGGSALGRCFPPHSLRPSHGRALLAGQMLPTSPLCPRQVQALQATDQWEASVTHSTLLENSFKKNHNPDFQCANSTFSWLFLLNFYCWHAMV